MITTVALLLAGTLSGNTVPGSSTSPVPIPIAISPLPATSPAALPLVYYFGGTITADNSYIVALGTNTLSVGLGSGCSTTSAQIFSCATGPESFGYSFASANLPTYVYIVAWGDDSVTNGVLANLQLDIPGTNFSLTRRSGDSAWQVYATGLDVDGCTAPTLATINAQIAIANAGSGNPATTSQGWVGKVPTANGYLEVGELNNADEPTGSCTDAFPQVCGMTEQARWMWYRSPDSSCAFTDGNQREFLIFRVPIKKKYKPL